MHAHKHLHGVCGDMIFYGVEEQIDLIKMHCTYLLNSCKKIRKHSVRYVYRVLIHGNYNQYQLTALCPLYFMVYYL